VLHLEQAGADPDVEQLDPAQAISRLTEALHDLPQRSPARLRRAAEAARVGIRLAVAGLVDNAQSPRPHLPLRGRPTGPNLPATRTVAAALAEVTAAGPAPALTLDPLTAVDNPAFFAALSAEPNLPDDIRKGLAAHLR
jgi:hypothetical protein